MILFHQLTDGHSVGSGLLLRSIHLMLVEVFVFNINQYIFARAMTGSARQHSHHEGYCYSY